MLEVLFACVCDRWMMVVRDPSCASVCYLRYVVACVCERCLWLHLPLVPCPWASPPLGCCLGIDGRPSRGSMAVFT
jgi:hypothetical protein